MTEFCLVRHGQTDWNFQEIIQGREDIPLNETGKKQALQSAQFLQNEKWDIIISSPLVRAQETARTVANAVKLDSIELDDRFIERNFGEASGKSIAEFREKIASGQVEGMETDEELVDRCYTALQDVAKKHEGKRIIIVAHSHAIKAILTAIAPEEVTFRTSLTNACANYITVDNDKWGITRYNVSEHICV
ncbi:histidine phosphatase family protein [Bacillus sp. 165]|uniref:histidine phosphatase family protein n=1 Tax=Bacillus sp. 165 TaxID=1529117 RepID=UPI001AD9F6C8|nr:histidine phosphatase family protein [Bacillus sp. 165]MBO9130289.1 histidine phosphatase family protein [Bacillus sp. 165]